MLRRFKHEGLEFPARDRLDTIAEKLYDAYAAAAIEAGRPNAASKLHWCQQPESRMKKALTDGPIHDS